jgi:hypothetical protein
MMIRPDEYLNHCYTIPETPPVLPLPDEGFAAAWKEAKGEAAQAFLTEITGRELPFPLQEKEALRIFFTATLGGRLPVIVAGNHEDFRCLEALLNGRNDLTDLPVTVNAFTLRPQAEKIRGHRLILLGQAPYSNVPAQRLGLEEEDWLGRSFRLRLAHECAHYETLRLFGDMKNNALDEILADAFGQMAAFGSFSAERQRLLFGLEPGTGICTGRLTFYCRGMLPWDKAAVYRAVDTVLDAIEAEINRFLAEKKGTTAEGALAAKKVAVSSVDDLLADHETKYELLALLAGTSIGSRI